MMNEINNENDIAKRLNKTLGLYKAEWLNEELYSLFDEPSYFEQLRTYRPCVLIGGRGTGKTTVLRGLSYEGQLALTKGDVPVKDWNYYGIYYRVNTNRVTAFRGGEISEEKWCGYFGHYINLSFCQLMLDFVEWYEKHTGNSVVLSKRDLNKVCASLGICRVDSIDQLSEEIEYSILDFEASINTISDHNLSKISVIAAPIDVLANALVSSETLRGKKFFFLIDEFENFEDYQQRVLNTIIKHANDSYTFKIGVRELGWRQRATLNPNEQLTSPADYARISITDWLNDSRFTAFAEKVVSRRIASAFPEAVRDKSKPQDFLPSLTEIDEAEMLLSTDEKASLMDAVKNLPKDIAEDARKIRVGHLHFIKYFNRGIDDRFHKEVRSWIENPKVWQPRVNNYFHASLFSIRKGKTGIRKYYSGWNTFVSLANGNIRYLLELVHAAFQMHIENQGSPSDPISPKSQTKAAENVGRKNLSELEGLSVDGGKLTKLVLSLGRIFQVMAADGAGHAPEVTQFYINQSGSDDQAIVNRILNQSVMHLALVRTAGTKKMSETDTAEYDYQLHPIFAPLFAYSYRRKRKFSLASKQLLDLIEKPKDTIRLVLSQSDRTDDDTLPDQLLLFGSFYEGY